jgi:hypothetical protein
VTGNTKEAGYGVIDKEPKGEANLVFLWQKSNIYGWNCFIIPNITVHIARFGATSFS